MTTGTNGYSFSMTVRLFWQMPPKLQSSHGFWRRCTGNCWFKKTDLILKRLQKTETSADLLSVASRTNNFFGITTAHSKRGVLYILSAGPVVHPTGGARASRVGKLGSILVWVIPKACKMLVCSYSNPVIAFSDWCKRKLNDGIVLMAHHHDSIRCKSSREVNGLRQPRSPRSTSALSPLATP